MDDDPFKVSIVWVFLWALLTLLIGWAFAFKVGEVNIKEEAVGHGYAEYVVDKEGIVTWRWK